MTGNVFFNVTLEACNRPPTCSSQNFTYCEETETRVGVVTAMDENDGALGALTYAIASGEWRHNIHTYIRTYVRTYVCMYVCMYVQYICVCMYIRTYSNYSFTVLRMPPVHLLVLIYHFFLSPLLSLCPLFCLPPPLHFPLHSLPQCHLLAL